MKYFNTLCIVSCLLFFNSCKNDKPSSISPSSNNEDTFLTATINGEDVAATMAVLAIKVEVSGVSFNTIVAEDKTNGCNFNLYHKVTAKGSPQDVQAFSIGYKEIGYIATKENLKFEITDESNTHLEGTFSFTAKKIGGDATTTVTNGKFRAKKKGWN